MNKYTKEWLFHQLDVLNLTVGQAVVLQGLTNRERKAYELLKDARLLILEEMEGTPEREKTEETSDEDLLEAFISKQTLQATLQRLEQQYFEAAQQVHNLLINHMAPNDAVALVTSMQNCLACCDAIRKVAEELDVSLLGEEETKQAKIVPVENTITPRSAE